MKIKLECPMIYQFKDGNHFAIITELILNEGWLFEYFGKSYNYDDGEAVYQGNVLIGMSVKEENYYFVDENRKFID